MAGVALGGQVVQFEDEVVPARPGQGHATVQLLAAQARQRGTERLRGLRTGAGGLGSGGGGGGFVLVGAENTQRRHQVRSVIGAGHRLVRGVQRWQQLGHEIGPCVDQFGAERHQTLVPDVEGAQLAGFQTGCPGGFQQGVALFEHPVVVGEYRGEPGVAQHQELVEEPPAAGGIAADQGQVFGGEEHAGEVAGEFAGLDDRTVDLGPVESGAVDLHLGEEIPAVVLQPGPDDRAVLPRPHHRAGLGHPVRAEGAEEAERFDQVGLALAVAAHDEVGAGAERDLRLGIVAEVSEGEVCDPHAGSVCLLYGMATELVAQCGHGLHGR